MTRKTSSGSSQQPLHLNNDISPGDNFYTYVNDHWLKKTTIPPTKSVFGASEEIEKQLEIKMNGLLKDCINATTSQKTHPSYLDSVKKTLGLFAKSVYTADKQQTSLATMQSVLHSIQSLQNKEEVAVVLGEFLRYKIRSVFFVYGQYENKNQTRYTYTIGTGSLGLPDPSFYFTKTLHRNKHLKSYKRLVERLGHLVGIPALPCVVALEKILAGVLLRTEKDTIEHERLGSELETNFAYIPFSILFDTFGLANWRNRIFYVESLRWLHTVNKLFHHLGLDYWKLLLSLEFLLFCLPSLPPPFSTLSFQFYRKQLRGQQAILPRKEQALYVLQGYATQFFSRLYVETFTEKETKESVKDMIENFLSSAKTRLESVEWLEPNTRKKAQEKVEKMKYSVAFPNSFEELPIPSLNSENLLHNVLQMGEWKTDQELKKLGQPLSQKKDWEDAVFVVNAYYYGQANEMIIPSGIMQEPFYNPNRSIAWNYGGLGCIICHEITHAFDKEGKEYNPQGLQQKWWTRTDNRNYNKQTKELIALYSKQRVYGFPVSGKKTLSENIADIGGMGIALDALRGKLNTMALTEEERKQAYRDFFVSYAVSWRLKEKKKKRIQALIMDKHAPPFLRVNLVVSQFQEWYDAFDVQKTDALYIPPEKRIRIF